MIKSSENTVPGSLPPELQRPKREVDHSPPSSGAEVKNALIYTSTSPIRLHGMGRS